MLRPSKSSWQRLRQRLSIYLYRPILGGHHAPEYTARGAAFGLLIAFSPTIGAQIPLLGLLWMLLHRVAPRYEFNLVAASAWTLTTNFFTAPPLFYLFVVTGRFILGRWDAIRGYDLFSQRYAASQDSIDQIWVLLQHDPLSVLEKFGVPLMIGWIPWGILAAWLGYLFTLKTVRLRRARKQARTTLQTPSGR